MDFSTIRGKLDSNMYGEHVQFANDMRLVFQNAMTYNSHRENMVHIAARELSGKFEEKYRVLCANIGAEVAAGVPQQAALHEPVPPAKKGKVAKQAPAKSTATSARQVAKDAAAAAAAAAAANNYQPIIAPPPRQRHSTGGAAPGGRALASAPMPSPPVATTQDAATLQMMQNMERRMADMQAELNALRSQQQAQAHVQQQATVLPAPTQQAPSSGRGTASRDRAPPAPRQRAAPAIHHAPVVQHHQPAADYEVALTFEEKKNLISTIQTLQPQKLERVVEIIQGLSMQPCDL